jgi:hypothetical protein
LAVPVIDTEVVEDPPTTPRSPVPDSAFIVPTVPDREKVGFPATPLASEIAMPFAEVAKDRFMTDPALLTMNPLPADSKDPEAPFKVI